MTSLPQNPQYFAEINVNVCSLSLEPNKKETERAVQLEQIELKPISQKDSAQREDDGRPSTFSRESS
jgi:hypothetical protein